MGAAGPELEIAVEPLAERLHARLIDEAGAGAELALEPLIEALVEREAAVLDGAGRAALVRSLLRRARGLGPLEPLLADPRVDEIVVNGCGAGAVFAERGGRLESTAAGFSSEAELRALIDRILGPLGRRVDESSPYVDARLPDGSRVNVVLPPLALDGPLLTIRRFREHGLDAAALVACGSWDPALRELLEDAVAARRAILVSGSTGAGKTTALNALSAFIDPAERVVTIEDTAELRLRLPHVVRLETRPAGVDGRGEVTIRDLVRNALRMRPDRIVVGEVRGGEALDMLGAMTTGHAGSLSTIHAGDPQAALLRLQTLALMAGVGLPAAAIGGLIADAVDLVLHVRREPDGRRRAVCLAEVGRSDTGPVASVIHKAPA